MAEDLQRTIRGVLTSKAQAPVMRPSAVKVGICIPSRRDWYAQFGMCLAALVQYAAYIPWREKTVQAGIFFRTTSMVDRSRTQLVNDALAMQADYILFIDDDQTFPPYLIHRLLEAGKDVVGINYVKKTFDKEGTASIDGDADHVRLLDSSVMTGITAVDRVGTGVLMVKATVFSKLSMPWFFFGHPDRKYEHPELMYYSEDYNFCRRAKDAGFEIFVDHDLSKEVGHLGSVIFTPDGVCRKQGWGTFSIEL